MSEEEECRYKCFSALCFCSCLLGSFLLIVVLCITFISSAKTVESDSIYIGDVLGNSSALFEVRTPTIATVDFEFDYETEIFKTNYIPPIITENLPLQHFVASSELLDNIDRQNFNYLGRYDPIYLLAGSSIQYNVAINNTKRFNSQYVACLYLFDNDVHFDNFINSDLNSQETASHCFESNAMTASYSFNIATNGLYYVGITLLGGVTIQANVSIVRKLYNITGLEQVCNYSQSCNIVICNTFICINETTTYFLINPTSITTITYTFLAPRIHGVVFAVFGALTLFGSIFCSCCCCICCSTFIFVCCGLVWEFFFEKNDSDDNNVNRPQHEHTDAASSIQVQQNLSNVEVEHHSRTFQENRGNFALYDEDLSLELYSSSVVDTNFNEEETNTSSTNLPNYEDIFNQRNATDLNLVAELELPVQSIERSTSNSINHNEDNEDNAVTTTPLLDSVVCQAQSIQPAVPLVDISLPLPSPSEEHVNISLHPILETESEEELPNAAERDDLVHNNSSTIDEERGHIQSSDEDASHALEPSIMPTVQSVPIYEPLPSDNMEKLDERHAPAILSAIQELNNHWNILGQFLCIDSADLERIRYNNSDVDHCRKEMIFAWLRHGNATRQKLIEALEDLGRNDLAHKVKKL